MGGRAGTQRRIDTVLILGAGASYGARKDHPGYALAPPLGDGLARYLLRWMDANRDAPIVMSPLLGDRKLPAVRRILEEIAGSEQAARPRFELVLERVLAELVEQGRAVRLEDAESIHAYLEHPHYRAIRCLNRLITLALCGGEECPFMDGPDLHDELLEQLGNRLRAVVTVNYDVLCEQALHRTGRGWKYAGYSQEGFGFQARDPKSHEGQGPSLDVIKFHGSIGWTYAGIGYTGGIPTPQHAAPASHDRNAPVLTQVKGLFRSITMRPSDMYRWGPLLASYAPGKPAEIGGRVIRQVQEYGQRLAREARRVIVLGLRPPSADDEPALAELIALAARCPARIYVSPLVEECLEMEQCGFEAWNYDFAGLIESGRLVATPQPAIAAAGGAA